MYLFHFTFCIFSFFTFCGATKLTCNEVTNSTEYIDCKVTFIICKYIYDEKCVGIDTRSGTNFEGLDRILKLIDFNPRERTAIIAHGFKSERDWMWDMGRKWALTEPDVNFIMVHWPNDHDDLFQYRRGALLTESVANKTAAFLEKLKQTYPEQRLQFHFVGHSLGAHLVGQAARIIMQRGIKVKRLTALDPALPCFKDNSSSLRLRKTDAEFVDVIHSNSGPEEMNFGIYEPMGHADFYPNGGNHFPECHQEISLWEKFKNFFKNHVYNCDGPRYHSLLWRLAKMKKIEYMNERLELFPDYERNDKFLEYFFCKNNDCNHEMAIKYFMESLNPHNKRRWANPVTFPINITTSVKCQNYNCNNEKCVHMGYSARKFKAEGAYYVNVNDDFTASTCS